VMYLMTRLTERARDLSTLRSIRRSADPVAARLIISGAVPPLVASILSEGELDSIHARLGQLPEPPARPRLAGRDFLGALGVFLLVVISTFPVVVPFMVMQETVRAMRVSHSIAVVLLFLCGFRLGQYAGHRPWRMGFAMAAIGSVLVALTIALGG